MIRLEELLIGRMHEQRPKMHFQAVMKVAGLIIVIFVCQVWLIKYISQNMRYPLKYGTRICDYIYIYILRNKF